MGLDRILVFDVKGEYAHFKKYYTTTSPLTFSVPPKTVIYGLVGAILGLSKEENDDNYYLKYFQRKSCKIGIQILNPIRKTRIPINLIDTKTAILMSRIKNRTQIRTEYVVNPHYRIYFYHQDTDLYNELKKMLNAHHTHYTISLGLSENIANYIFKGELEINYIKGNEKILPISSVVLIDGENIQKGDVDFSQPGQEYFVEKIALEMKEDREVLEYGDVIYERNGNKVFASPDNYYQLENGENIMLI